MNSFVEDFTNFVLENYGIHLNVFESGKGTFKKHFLNNSQEENNQCLWCGSQRCEGPGTEWAAGCPYLRRMGE